MEGGEMRRVGVEDRWGETKEKKKKGEIVDREDRRRVATIIINVCDVYEASIAVEKREQRRRRPCETMLTTLQS